MANGRMITKDICGDKRINCLSSDTSRMAFTWLITFADREGRTHGDPAMVRSMLFPRRQDVTIEQMEQMIIEWANLSLVIWYECDGDLWLWFPGFEKNQPGLRKDKEAPSKIPEPSFDGADLVRSKYGLSTDLVPLKRKEEKGREGTGTPPPPPIVPTDGDMSSTIALELYREVTGLAPDAGREPAVIADIVSLQRRLHYPPRAVMLDTMRDKYAAWCSTTTGDGKPYSPTNPAWLQWCITGVVPAKPNGAAHRPVKHTGRGVNPNSI